MSALQIAKTIAMPGRTTPLRLPNFPALERTATMAFNVSTPATVGSGDTRVMLTRQAFYPLWMDVGKPNSLPNFGVTYGAAWTTSVIGGFATNYMATAAVTGNHVRRVFNNTVVDGVLAPGVTNSGGTWASFNTTLLGMDAATGTTEWLYVPAGAHLLCSVAKNTASATFDGTVSIEIWQSPGDVAEYTASSLSFSATANAKSAAATPYLFSQNTWVRPKSVNIVSSLDNFAHDVSIFLGASLNGATAPTFTGSLVDAGTWSCTSISDPQLYFVPVAVSPEFQNSNIPWSGTRVTALSALFTNTTKVLNKEGTVLWGRLNPVTFDVWNVGKASLNNLHPAEKSFLDLEQGSYTYAPPSTDLSDFNPYYVKPESALVTNCPIYRLDNASMVNMGVFYDPDGGTNLAINVDWHIEFRSTSTLFSLGVSTLTLEALHGAQVGLLKAGFFYSNFDHVALLNGIVKAVGSLNPFLRMAAPLARGLLGASSVAISNRSRPNNRPTSTTGTRSGIVGPKARRAQVVRRLPPFRKTKQSTVTRSKRTVDRANAAMNRIIARRGRQASFAR